MFPDPWEINNTNRLIVNLVGWEGKRMRKLRRYWMNKLSTVRKKNNREGSWNIGTLESCKILKMLVS